MSVIAEHGQLLLLLSCLFGFLMAWGVGANDVANAMGTSVGSKALTIKQAIFIAIIFEFCGAYLAGGEVTSTIRKGIIDPGYFADTPELLVYGMSSALLAAGIWLAVASVMGWPVSTTHSIVGAIVGFTAVGVSSDAVAWGKVGQVVASWVVSPVLAGTMSCLLFLSAQKLIMDKDDPFAAAKRYIPLYLFLVGFMISMVTLTKGLKHIGLGLNFSESLGLSTIVAILITGIGMVFMSRIQPRAVTVDPERPQANDRFADVERVFAVLMVFTACAMAFAHGSNDVANAIGPVAAIASVIESGGQIAAKSALPAWVLLLGAGGIVFGLATYGFKVIATIGTKITELTPSRGFAAELGAASTVVLASATGLPISTTHTLVGAVLGVGLARGVGALNLRVIGNIFLSWLVTLPAGAILAIIFFFCFTSVFGG